jgi:hypothetical protein
MQLQKSLAQSRSASEDPCSLPDFPIEIGARVWLVPIDMVSEYVATTLRRNISANENLMRASPG